MTLRNFLLRACLVPGVMWGLSNQALATENHTYKAGEYTRIVHGLSPNGTYALATHGEGYLGYENFHVYLMNAKTGKKIGPLEEAANPPLDTGAGAYEAKWSADSKEVTIRYRKDRHEGETVRYRIDKGRATLIGGPTEEH